jgi:hypothetical protein
MQDPVRATDIKHAAAGSIVLNIGVKSGPYTVNSGPHEIHSGPRKMHSGRGYHHPLMWSEDFDAGRHTCDGCITMQLDTAMSAI